MSADCKITVRLPNGDIALMAEDRAREIGAEPSSSLRLAVVPPAPDADKPRGDHFMPRELADHFGLGIDEVRIALDEADPGRYVAFQWAEAKAACNRYVKRNQR